MVPDFMSQAPRPYILPSFTTGENGGVSHMSSGPVGTTSQWPCRISDFPALLCGTVGSDHGARPGKIMLDRAEAAQILEVVDVDMPVVDLVAALAQEIADHVLARPFRAAGRGDRDEIACGGQLRVEAGIDGVEDFLLGIESVHFRHRSLWRRVCRRARIKPYFPAMCRRF